MIKWKYFKKEEKKNHLDRTYLLDIQLLKALLDKVDFLNSIKRILKSGKIILNFWRKGNEKVEIKQKLEQ